MNDTNIDSLTKENPPIDASSVGPVEEVEIVLNKGKNYVKQLGPGLITGAADDDPSGIATYSQAGAQFGTGLIWLSLWTFPIMSMIQEMCARIALVTGQGLAANIRKAYPRNILYFCTILLFVANTFNIGADLGAMAKVVQLIFPNINFALLVIGFGVVGLILQIFLSYKKYFSYLKWLTLALFAYIATGFLVNIDWGNIAIATIIPNVSFTKNTLFMITAIFGTTISPYLFFWQTSQEVEEEIAQGRTTGKLRRGTNPAEIKRMRTDVWSGMLLSNTVMFFIIAVCATTLFSNGITNINTAADAAMALRPLAGEGAYILFALGIIGTGMLAVPILAGSTSYAISETFNWKEGLYRKLKEARAFYAVLSISVIVGILINFIGIDPIKALLYSAVVNGIIAPIIIICILGISSNKKVMGVYKNSRFGTIVGFIVVAIMSITAIATIISLIK